MEEQKEKMIHGRIENMEKRQDNLERKLDNLDEKVHIVDDKHDNRYLETVKFTTEIKGISKATQQASERMANSIENLVDELKQSNSRTDDRFKKVDEDVSNVRSKLEQGEAERKVKIEEKQMSNRTLGFIIVGGFGVLQVFIQVLAPIFFGG